MPKFIIGFSLIANSCLFAQTIVTLDLPNPCSISGIEENTNNKNSFCFSAHPNPAQDLINITIKSAEKVNLVNTQFISMQSIVVLSEQIFSGNDVCIKPFNVSKIPPGLYIIAVSRGDERIYQKIIIK